MRDQLDRFNQSNVQLLAIDPHEHWSAKYLLKDSGFGTDDLNYPLLTDAAQTVSAMYGVASTSPPFLDVVDYATDSPSSTTLVLSRHSLNVDPNPSQVVDYATEFGVTFEVDI